MATKFGFDKDKWDKDGWKEICADPKKPPLRSSSVFHPLSRSVFLQSLKSVIAESKILPTKTKDTDIPKMSQSFPEKTGVITYRNLVSGSTLSGRKRRFSDPLVNFHVSQTSQTETCESCSKKMKIHDLDMEPKVKSQKCSTHTSLETDTSKYSEICKSYDLIKSDYHLHQMVNVTFEDLVKRCIEIDLPNAEKLNLTPEKIFEDIEQIRETEFDPDIVRHMKNYPHKIIKLTGLGMRIDGTDHQGDLYIYLIFGSIFPKLDVQKQSLLSGVYKCLRDD